jgi:hypothetical protein
MTTAFPGQLSPIPTSFQAIALTSSAAQGLTLVKNAGGVYPRYALLQVMGVNVNWRDDGVAPTNTIGGGMVLLAGGPPIGFLGNLSTAMFISVAAGGSTLLVSYYA